MSFCTRDVPVHARFRSWEGHLRKTLGDVRVSGASDAEFDAWTQSVSHGGVSVTRVGAEANQLQLFSSRRGDLADDLIHVVFLTAGRFQVEQFGRRTVLEPGDWSVVVVSEAFRHAHDCPVEMLVVAAPRRVLFPAMGVDQFSALRFSATHGSALLAKNFLGDLITERASLHPLSAHELTSTAVRLVRLSVVDNLGLRTHLASRELRQVRIREFVEQNLQNAELSVDLIAQECRCSKRYVHKVFSSAEAGSVSNYILKARLDHCFRDLQRLAMAHLSVTQIAFSWGFNSPGHFSRVFRRQFGISPSQCRTTSAMQFTNGNEQLDELSESVSA
jgi:AraC-like DNA-binding protein